MIGRSRPTTLLLAATLLALPFVAATALGGFAWFDDEGTLLVWFRSWLDGHRMYDEVFCLYGPLYTLTYGFFYGVLHIPLTHTSGRLIAAAMWLLYTAGFAALCFRLTRSLAAAAASYLIVLVWLAPLMNTPGHPEELGLVLMAAALLLASDPAASRTRLAALAAAVTGLALIKVNFGAFVGGGILLALLRATPQAAIGRLLVGLVGMLLLLLPAALMAVLSDQGWVRLYCACSTLAIGAALLTAFGTEREARLRPSDWAVMAAAALAMAVVVVGGMMLAGSSAGAILNAMLFQNANFIRNWSIPLDEGPQGALAATMSAATAIAYRATAGRSGPAWFRLLAIVALKAAVVVSGLLLMTFPAQPIRMITPFCWLLLVPPPGERVGTGRVVAGLVGATMSLYAFPVGGAQMLIGALVPLALLPMLALDVLAGLQALGLRVRPPRAAAWSVIAASILFGTMASGRAVSTYVHDQPLGLPGTRGVRVDPNTGAGLRWVTAALASCRRSYTFPGLWSFAFWTGQPLLTPVNVNGVMNFIGPAEQTLIVSALSREPDLCVVESPRQLRFFDRGQVRADPPLLHYIRGQFTPAEERHGYVILRRKAPAPD